MSEPFKSDEVFALWQKYKSVSHPDYPFLDKSYSPSSHIPCCDLTLDVAQLILDDKIEAVWELLGFLGARNNEILIAQVPKGLSIEDFGAAEILAAFLLTWRMGCAAHHAIFVGTEVLASILASYHFSLTEECFAHLKALATRQVQEQKQASPIYSGADDFAGRCDCDGKVQTSFQELLAIGDSDECNVTSGMKTTPPMVRIALASYFLSQSDYWSSKVRFGNGYGERIYGCSEEIGIKCAASMEFLENIMPRSGQFPKEITKENLYDELRGKGLAPSKSWPKQKLIDLAIADEALLKNLMQKYAPGLVRVKPQFQGESEQWFRRYSLARSLARGILADMISNAFSDEFHVPLSEVENESAETVMETAKSLVRGREHYDTGMTRGAFAAFPARELIQVRDINTPHDWTEHWTAAGGKTYKGRMVAMKGDPIWLKISHFGNPWPPFDFGGLMGVTDIEYDEAVELGLINGDEQPQTFSPGNREIADALKSLGPDFTKTLIAELDED